MASFNGAWSDFVNSWECPIYVSNDFNSLRGKFIQVDHLRCGWLKFNRWGILAKNIYPSLPKFSNGGCPKNSEFLIFGVLNFGKEGYVILLLLIYQLEQNSFIFKVPSIHVDKFSFIVVEELFGYLVQWFQIDLQ